jgi:hyperosmotically inducible protein
MKTRLWTIFFVGLFCLSGCTAVYKAAVDERSLGAQVDDEKIEAAILAKFIGDENIKALDLTAKSFEGNVYLVGEYESAAQQARAIAIVKEAEGVKSFTPYLLPKKALASCGTSDNLRIRGEVEAKLIGDKSIWSTNVHVRVFQCRVVLMGVVGTAAETQKAVAHARGVKGVQDVKSYLRSKK